MKRIIPIIFLLLLKAGSMTARQAAHVFDDFRGKTELLSLRSIARETDGPAWLGSANNLYSFDGYDLVPYPYPEGPLNIQCILVREDSLLLGTDHGLFSFDPVNKTYGQLEAFGDKDTHSIIQDGHILFCGTASGLYRFNPETHSSERISGDNVFPWSGRMTSSISGAKADWQDTPLPTIGSKCSLIEHGFMWSLAFFPKKTAYGWELPVHC